MELIKKVQQNKRKFIRMQKVQEEIMKMISSCTFCILLLIHSKIEN